MKSRKRWLLAASAAWDTGWKLAALWRAYRRGDWKWMPPLLMVSSGGVLPILYLCLTRQGGADGDTEAS